MAAIELNDQIEPINIERFGLHILYCSQAAIFNISKHSKLHFCAWKENRIYFIQGIIDLLIDLFMKFRHITNSRIIIGHSIHIAKSNPLLVNAEFANASAVLPSASIIPRLYLLDIDLFFSTEFKYEEIGI